MKKIASLFLALCLFVPLFSSCARSKGSVTFLDGEGNEIARFDSFDWKESEVDPAFLPYLTLAAQEAVNIVSDEKGISTEQAKKELLRNQTVIETSFQPDLCKAMENACKQYEDLSLSCGLAATDLDGNLIAVYSDGKTGENFAAVKIPPYSSFKPLSVYMQAFEQGLINWSGVYEDSPVKKVLGADGKEYDWPSNATNTYTHQKTTICAAVMQSLNTVATKCLLDVGVRNSVRFLKENLGLNLSWEESRMNLAGEEEIIGNISMGYLYEGTSPVEMAGFYQIFANGGVYTEPKAVLSMKTEGERWSYQRVKASKQVISQTTAELMNRLLQKVVSPGGTGAKAAVDEIPVGGKTGTGDNGNWFVGFTPSCTLSVWHGMELESNHAPELFADVLGSYSFGGNDAYPATGNIKEGIFCPATGLLVSQNCKKAELGYYEKEKMPLYCEE